MVDKRYFLQTLQVLSFLAILVTRLPAQELQNNNCKLVMNGPVYLILHDMSLYNNGDMLAANSHVAFTGNESVRVGGSHLPAFNHVAINKLSGKTVELQQDISVDGTLAMIRGNILLNKHRLDLGSTGTLAGEGSQSHITGTSGGSVLVTRKLTTPPIAINPGNIGVELTSEVAPGKLVIERKHEQESLPDGIMGIQRSFIIRSTKNGANMKLRFYYLDEELAGIAETELAIWTDPDVNNSWIPAGRDDNDAVLNWVSKGDFQSLGRFTLAGRGAAFRGVDVDRNNAKYPGSFNPGGRSMVKVYPNPSQDKCTLIFFSRDEKQAVLGLYNQQGRLLQQKHIRCQPGMNKVEWDIGQYAAGSYFIADDEDLITVTILKL